MSSSRPVFRSRWLPYLLVAPQLIITVIFFIWPAGEALWYSLQSVDPFGFSSQFVGLDNFVTLFHDSYYLDAFWTTIKFSTFVTVSGLLVSLFFAALVEYIVRGSRFYQTLMLLPYAVAPAVAAVLWIFLFNPGRGLITHFLAEFGYDWNHAQNSGQAMFLAMQDAGVEEITSNPELYVKYLDMQGDNPTYSAGNIALVMFQDPEATVFGTAERWKTLNRGVIDQERSKGVKIFARNTLGRGYRLTDAYDIRQTQGRDLKKVQLKDDSKEMSIALRAILNYSVVPVATDHDLPVAAYYDSKNMELAVNPAFSDSEAFAAIAAEVAHSRIHAKGANPNYDHEEVDLDAQSISYILCRQFGIKRDTPDLSRLEELYEGWDPQQRRSALDQIQGMSKQFGGSIERNITPQQRSRIPPQRHSR